MGQNCSQSSGKMDCELVSRELLISLRRWRRLFSKYGPTRTTEEAISSLKSSVSAEIF